MVDKRISDLEVTTTIEDTTLFHVRKTETNEDFKITKSNLVKQIGNSVVIGFNATSPLANRILLSPSNSGSLDQYYNGMTIKFISPIDSTDLVKVKIGTLDYIDFKTTFTNPITNLVENAVLKTGKFYEAIYNNNSFIQTNIDRQYTNEYLSIGEIIFDNVTQENFTLYTLTSATSYYKTSYYEGMSIVFTSGIINNSVENMSDGKIYIDVDGLGEKLLSDPDGDGVPFSLQPNETILGIYDGEKFIKNMFTMEEPALPVPVDPDNPPPGYDITIYVGPDEPEQSNRLLQTAYEKIIKDFGNDGGGRRVLIKFRDNYTGQGLNIGVYTGNNGYITFEGNPNVIMIGQLNELCIFSVYDYAYNSTPKTTLNLTGTWKCRFPQTGINISNEYCFFRISSGASLSINIKNALIENENLGNQNFYFLSVRQTYSYGNSSYIRFNDLILENVEIKNFGAIFHYHTSGYYEFAQYSFQNVILTNTISQVRSFNKTFFEIKGNFSIDGLQINITKPSNYDQNSNLGLIRIESFGSGIIIHNNNFEVKLKNCNIILNEIINYLAIIYIEHVYARDNSSFSVILENCVVKYNSTINNLKQSIFYSDGNPDPKIKSTLTIFGNDFGNKNTSTIPDILVSGGELFIRSSTTIGSTSAINGGKITVIQ